MTKKSHEQPPTGQARQPRRMIDETGSNDFDREQMDIPIDDPGDAQRSSKSEADGDGEEGPLNPGSGYPSNPELLE